MILKNVRLKGTANYTKGEVLYATLPLVRYIIVSLDFFIHSTHNYKNTEILLQIRKSNIVGLLNTFLTR